MELSMEFDLSLGKILLGFAGVSVAVCAYKFHSSNNNEEVSCSDGEDISSELNQSCCTEDKKVKLPETSKELVSVGEKRFVGRNKLLINPKKVKIPKIKPAVICPEPKVSPAVSSMDLNEVSEIKEILESDNCLTQNKNKNFKPNSAPVEKWIYYPFDEDYMKDAFLGIFSHQQKVFVLKYHMNELEKVLTQMENTELSAVKMEKLVLKRVEQLKSKTTRFFKLGSYQIELKVWEILFEQTDIKRKKVHDFDDFIKVLKLINEFYGYMTHTFEKYIELCMLRLNSPQKYKYDFNMFFKNISEKKIATLNCIKSNLNNRLDETVETVKTLLLYSSSHLLNAVTDEDSKHLNMENDILESKQIFDSLVTCLRVERLSNYVLTQQKQLEQTLTDLSNRETTTENYTTLINKRIKQLKEASGENNLLTELFSCELTKWTSLSTDPNSSAKFPKDVFEDINLCYGYLITASGNTDHMKLKPGNGIQIDCNEINGLLECYKSLLDIAWSIDNLLFLLILKVVINLQSELITIM